MYNFARYRRFKDLKISLFSKLASKLVRGEKSLWTNIFHSKYLKGQTFFKHRVSQDASSVWKGIIEARQLIIMGACYKLGDGASINPWTDPWIRALNGAALRPKSGIYQDFVDKVANLRKLDGSWDSQLVENLFWDEDS